MVLSGKSASKWGKYFVQDWREIEGSKNKNGGKKKKSGKKRGIISPLAKRRVQYNKIVMEKKIKPCMYRQWDVSERLLRNFKCSNPSRKEKIGKRGTGYGDKKKGKSTIT